MTVYIVWLWVRRWASCVQFNSRLFKFVFKIKRIWSIKESGVISWDIFKISALARNGPKTNFERSNYPCEFNVQLDNSILILNGRRFVFWDVQKLQKFKNTHFVKWIEDPRQHFTKFPLKNVFHSQTSVFRPVFHYTWKSDVKFESGINGEVSWKRKRVEMGKSLVFMKLYPSTRIFFE